ncbi:hypothetical protein HMPREF2815_17730 [Bacteroides sp. HMSC068A09]|nr:hypothetical protein HMPREF2815_17730 [Bacteroides sp. HMSC068A09]OFK95136.1 hypothetical protein HMPREF2794_17840 [Bacteroides sp. HMSC067B03]
MCELISSWQYSLLKFLIFFEKFLATLFRCQRGKELYQIFFRIAQVQGGILSDEKNTDASGNYL